MAGVTVGAAFAVVPRARRHVHLAADDWFHAGGVRRRVEVDCAVQDSVVGDAHSRLPHHAGAVNDLANARGAVEQ